jgi:hypothetical protein
MAVTMPYFPFGVAMFCWIDTVGSNLYGCFDMDIVEAYVLGKEHRLHTYFWFGFLTKREISFQISIL